MVADDFPLLGDALISFSVSLRVVDQVGDGADLQLVFRLANSIRSGSRAMLPSSLRISQITAAGSQPAMAKGRSRLRYGRRAPARRQGAP